MQCWAVKFGVTIAKRVRSTTLERGDKWHLDELVVTINGRKHWLWRAVDQHGAVLDVLVQSRRDTAAAKRLMRKLLKRHGRPRVIVTDKLRSHAAANNGLGLNVEHRQHKGLNNWADNSHQPTRVREKVVLMGCRYHRNARHKRGHKRGHKREARAQAIEAWAWASCARMAA